MATAMLMEPDVDVAALGGTYVPDFSHPSGVGGPTRHWAG